MRKSISSRSASRARASATRWDFDRVPRRLLALVVGLGALVWGATASFDYTLDDHGIVHANALVERFDLRGMFTSHYRAGSTVEEEPDAAGYLYRPVPLLTFAVDHAFSGGRPFAGHLTNGLLHALAAALTWIVLRRLRTPVPVAAAAAMFAWLHPVHVESVANIKHREEVLAALGVLAAWYATERAWGAGRGRARVGWSLAAGVALLAGLLSKESAIFALVAIPLSSWLLFSRVERPWRRMAAMHASLFGALAAMFALRIATIGAFAATVGNEVFFLPSEGFPTRLLTSAKVWSCWYAGRGAVLMTYPTGFSSRVDVRIEEGWPSPGAWAGLALVASSALGALVAWRRGRGDVAFWVSFFWIALFPTSNLLLPIGSVGAYRFLYLPSLAWGVLGGVALLALVRRLLPGERAAAAFWGALAALALVFAAGTASELRNWRDDRALNRADLRRTASPRARYVEAWASADPRERERWLKDAVRIMEDVPGSARGTDTTVLARSLTDLAEAALARADGAEAERLAAKAIAVLDPDARFHRYRAFPLAVLARAAEGRGDRTEAIARWRASAREQPIFAIAYLERARLEEAGGSDESAVAALREGIETLRAAGRPWLRGDLARLEGALREVTARGYGLARRPKSARSAESAGAARSRPGGGGGSP